MRSPGRRRPVDDRVADGVQGEVHVRRRGAAPARAQTTWNSGASVPPSKRSALSAVTSTTGGASEHQVAQDLARRRGLQEAVAGEPGGVEEARHLLGLADHRVVVRAHVVEPRPAALDRRGGDPRRAPLGDLQQRRDPLLGPLQQEAGRLVRVGHAHQQAAAFAVEVEAGREVDRQRQLVRQVGHRRGEQHLPAQRRDVERHADQLPARARPRSRGADDRARGDGPVRRAHAGDDAVAHVDPLDRRGDREVRAVLARAERVALHDRLGRGVRVGVAVAGGEDVAAREQRADLAAPPRA